MDEQYKLDSKNLNKMLVIKMLLELVVTFVVVVPFYAMKLNKDLIEVLTMIVTSCIVTYYLVVRYQKKLDVKIPYKIDVNFNVITYLKYALMALGAAWLASSIMSLIMEFLSGVLILDTPDFSAKYDIVTNVFIVIHAVIVAPVAEEMVCRGIMLNKLKKYGNTLAIVIVSIVFALLHGNLPQTIPAFIMSIFLCIVTLKSNSILPAISIHMINNGIAQLSEIKNDNLLILLNIMIIIVIIIGLILIIKSYKKVNKEKFEYRIKDYFDNWAGILILIFAVLSIIGSVIIL